MVAPGSESAGAARVSAFLCGERRCQRTRAHVSFLRVDDLPRTHDAVRDSAPARYARYDCYTHGDTGCVRDRLLCRAQTEDRVADSALAANQLQLHHADEHRFLANTQ